ncbi:MAG TPA: alpha/beta fold hydrolase [Actinomycetota bacterium]|nr:alpha/beta fold hydrolase [Actinomycetota bacterium]
MRAADSKLVLRATWLATRAAAAVSPALAGPPAARLWFTPWRIEPGERALARQAEWLKDTEPVSFSAGRHRIAGYAGGSGPTVLLVHGWGERAASLGAFVAPLVAAGYRVVGMDVPAHGGSSGSRTDGFEVAEAIRGVCDEIGDVRGVVAHSMGAMTATYAVSQGLALDALVLLAPSVRLDSALETFAGMFKLPPAATIGLRRTIDRRYGADVWARFSGPALAGKVDLPALIVHDRDDPQVALADAVELAAEWTGARLVTTEGLGHGRILRDPRVVEEVVSFLRSTIGAVSERVEA